MPEICKLHAGDAQIADLSDPDGHVTAVILLHIQGDEAWWRWSCEPFEED